MVDDMFNEVVDDNDDDSVANMYLNAAGIDDEDMNRLMDCHRLDMSVSVDCSILKEEYLDVGNSLVKTDLCDDDDFDYRHADDTGLSNVTIMSDAEDAVDDETDADGFRSMEALKSEDEDEDEDDYDEDDEGFPVSMAVRDMYLNAENVADGGGTLQETVCEICATVFKTRYNLLRHFQKRHPEYKMFECDLCRISFPAINEFKEHLEKEHSKMHTTQSVDSKQVRFACDVCGNMYKNKASAMNHLLTHTAKKTVRCARCDFSCYTKQQLAVHQTKHDKRFFCDICHKRFAQKSQLDVHVNAVHYNQRPYSCVLCNKTFKTKGSHDAHMVVHTDTRNYQCPHCDKKCRKRYDLTLHIRTHTGEKPFKCSVCGRGFVQMCDTRKHEMLHFKRGKKKNVYYPQMSDAMDDE